MDARSLSALLSVAPKPAPSPPGDLEGTCAKKPSGLWQPMGRGSTGGPPWGGASSSLLSLLGVPFKSARDHS